MNGEERRGLTGEGETLFFPVEGVVYSSTDDFFDEVLG